MFTGETSEEQNEKHNLKLDYAAMLQVQIREQNAKKEQQKLQKQEEQRREREEMDRMLGGKAAPATASAPSVPKESPRAQASPEKAIQKPPLGTSTSQLSTGNLGGAPPSPTPFVPQYQEPQLESGYRSSFTTAAFASPFTTSAFPPRAVTSTQELDAVQRLRHELEEARRHKLQVSKELYQKPNFMLPTEAKAAVRCLPSPSNNHALESPLAKEERRFGFKPDVNSRPSTPHIDASSNQLLESSSSFISVVGEKRKGLEPQLQVESCFVPIRVLRPEPHESPVKANHFEGLEDSIDDIDGILHAFLAKQR
ncbi:hypothetical protein ACHHYP_01061 [Achlya hypogyna]|uniref:Uncharacterized protein n=1 Tax=Achlya hypogyna TaxID=1202772 RepID=A0A1V9ZTS9_ACHHY|nr:hypothetical protein ACHHYP_01061 [Achlya hypogyna]